MIRAACCVLLLLATLAPVPAQETTRKKAKKKPPAPFQWVNPLNPSRKDLPGITHATFPSPSMDVPIGYCVYLPPGYHEESNKDRRYPVVYFLHGGRPGNETKLIHLATFIDRAIRAGEIPPTIYVFNNGGPVSHYDYPGKEKALGKTALVKELIPHIDRTYRTIAGRAGRSIEGYSQGGRGTLRIAFEFPDLFVAASAGSAGLQHEKRIAENEGLENPGLRFTPGDDAWTRARTYARERRNDSPLSLLLYTGNSMKDFNYEANLGYAAELTSLGIPHEHLRIPDVGHSTRQAYEKEPAKLLGFHARAFRASGAVPE